MKPYAPIPVLALLALLHAGPGSAPALAQHEGPSRHHDAGTHATMAALLSHLDLDEAQREELAALHERHSDEGARLHSRVNAAHEAVARSIHVEPFDEGSLLQAAAEYAQLQTDLFVMQAEHLQELRRILTAEQLRQAHELHLLIDAAHRGPQHHASTPRN